MCVQEADLGYLWTSPPTLVGDRVRAWFLEALEKAGVEGRMGPSLFTAFRAAGLPGPRLLVEAVADGGPDLPSWGWANVVSGAVPLMERLGVATRAEVDPATLADRLAGGGPRRRRLRHRPADDRRLGATIVVTPDLDVPAIRGHFAFPETGRIVTNNAASTQPPRELMALYASLAPGYENVHRGQSSASREMTARFEEAYDTIARFIGAPGPGLHRALPEHDGGRERGHVLAAHGVPRRRQRRDDDDGPQLQLRPVVRDVPGDPAAAGAARGIPPGAVRPLVAFNVAGRDPVGVADALNRAGVESRAGCHCATLAHHALKLSPPASCRLSFYLYNTLEEVDLAVEAVAAACR